MRKALSLALAGLCLAAPVTPAANFEAGPVAPIPTIRLGEALQTALPTMNLPPAEMGTFGIIANRFHDASVSLPQLAAETPLSGPAATQAVLSSVQELRAKFSDDELKNMPAGELGGVGQLIIDRLQGASSLSGAQAGAISPFDTNSTLPARGGAGSATLAPDLPTPARSLYLLSKPLEVSAGLGPVAQIGHYAFEIGFHLIKSYLLLRAGVHVAAVAAEFAWSAAKGPAMISIQSMGHLQARYWWTKLKTLKTLARIPNVERIAVLTGTETHFNKVVASRQDNRGLIFLETDKPLASTATLGHGAPLLIADPSAARIKLSLEVAGREQPSTWTPSLQDLLDRKTIPPGVAKDWRAQIHEAKKDMTSWKRFFDLDFERNLKVHAVLIDASGKEMPLGVLSQGQSTKRLLGITRIDQTVRWAKTALGISPARIQTLLTATTPYPERSIPLSDTRVERGPSASSWREIPSRLLRRLLGRMIVVRP